MRVKTTGKIRGYVIVVSIHHEAYANRVVRYPAEDFVFGIRVQDGELTVSCTGSPAGTLFPSREVARRAMKLPWKATGDSWERWSRWDILAVGEYGLQEA